MVQVADNMERGHPEQRAGVRMTRTLRPTACRTPHLAEEGGGEHALATDDTTTTEPKILRTTWAAVSRPKTRTPTTDPLTYTLGGTDASMFRQDDTTTPGENHRPDRGGRRDGSWTTRPSHTYMVDGHGRGLQRGRATIDGDHHGHRRGRSAGDNGRRLGDLGHEQRRATPRTAWRSGHLHGRRARIGRHGNLDAVGRRRRRLHVQ